MLTLFRSLRHRPFALLWLGNTVSVLGDKVFQVALAWWVLQKTGSGVAMGTVFILSTTPMLFFLLLGGVIVDRFPRFALMVLSDVLRGLVIGLAALLAFYDALEIWHVYAFSLIFGTVDAFFTPAFRAVFPQVIPPADLPSANSLASLSRRISGILGPALGGGIVLLGGTALAFWLDAVSFAFSALCLLPLLGLALPPRATERQSIRGDVREGIGTVFASPWLWLTIALAGISNIAYAGPMEVGVPFLLKDNWGADANVLGLFYSAASLGSFFAAVWLGRVTRLHHRGLALYGAWTLIGGLIMVIGLPVGIPLILAASFIMGICQTTIDLNWENLLQEFVPPERLGRVASVDYLGSFLLLPVGYFVGGLAVDRLGPAPVFLIGGAFLVLLVSFGLLHPRIRALD